MAILITSMGNALDVVYEVLAFTNFASHTLYNNHQNRSAIEKTYNTYFDSDPVSDVWLYTTDFIWKDGISACSLLDTLQAWNNRLSNPYNIKCYILPFDDIATEFQAEYAREVAFRLVGLAHSTGKKVYISFAAGRKTIASDLQSAGSFFGCDAYIHVLSSNPKDFKYIEKTEVSAEEINHIIPLFYGREKANILSSKINIHDYPLTGTNDGIKVYLNNNVFTNQNTLVETCHDLQEKAHNVYVHQRSPELLYNFPILQQLGDGILQKLKEIKIESEEQIRGLPKIDLHCHLGGSLDVTDCVDIAYNLWSAHQYDPAFIIDPYTKIETIKQLPFTKRIGLLASFKGNEAALEQSWYGAFLDEAAFCGLYETYKTFDVYEQLGDLQGSVLLQTKEIIGLAVQRLLAKAKQDNCIALEIRCSPQNYTKEGLTYREVLQIILETIDTYRTDMAVGVILIASRHRKMSEMYETIEQFTDVVEGSNTELKDLVNKYVIGFDVAGDEKARSPAELRSVFIALLQQCFPITIHAGEIQDAQKIWEAVYELNADRIGHGLTLIDNPDLLLKFLNRNIGIELCPSSNYQIVGFKDYSLLHATNSYKEYPLQGYLQNGLKVTINTDNRGISRTNLCREFVKASHMTNGGLSLLDALQLSKNSIDISFFPYKVKQELFDSAQTKIGEWLKSLHLV